MGYAGVVVAEIEPTIGIDRALDERLDRVGVSNIAGLKNRLAARGLDQPDRFLAARDIDVAYHD